MVEGLGTPSSAVSSSSKQHQRQGGAGCRGRPRDQGALAGLLPLQHDMRPAKCPSAPPHTHTLRSHSPPSSHVFAELAAPYSQSLGTFSSCHVLVMSPSGACGEARSAGASQSSA